MSLTSQLGVSNSQLANIQLAPIPGHSSGSSAYTSLATLTSTFAVFIAPPPIKFTGELGDKLAPAAFARFILAYPGVLAPVPPSQLTGIIGDETAPALLGSFILGYGALVNGFPNVQFTSAVTLHSFDNSLGSIVNKVTMTSTFAAVHLFGFSTVITMGTTMKGVLVMKSSFNSTVTMGTTMKGVVVHPTAITSTVTMGTTFTPHLILNPKLNILVDSLLSGGFKKED